jgi:hypothetical protein
MSGDAKDDDIRFEPDRFTETCSKIYSKWKVIFCTLFSVGLERLKYRSKKSDDFEEN